MREIKFRAWIPKNWDGEGEPKEYEMTYELAFEEYESINELIRKFKSPLMQYTGLKDKNDTEIYFQDVCRIEGYDTRGDYHNHTLLVEDWYNVVAHYGIENAIEAGLTIEVIGNIYEHKHIIE